MAVLWTRALMPMRPVTCRSAAGVSTSVVTTRVPESRARCTEMPFSRQNAIMRGRATSVRSW